jgi:nitrite reductase (NO-forming)
MKTSIPRITQTALVLALASVLAGCEQPQFHWDKAEVDHAAMHAQLTPMTAAMAQHMAENHATGSHGALVRVTLKSGMADGKMAFIGADGKANPVIRAKQGDTIEIQFASGEGSQHDFVVPDLKVASKRVDGRSGPAMVMFKADKPGKFPYFCSLPGHRQAGMEGTVEVLPTASSIDVAAHTAVENSLPRIAHNPSDIPAPVGHRAPQLVKYNLETVEVQGRLDDGTSYTYWTFNKQVPGPMMRVRVGDTVQLTLKNAPNSTMVHSIDMHAVIGPGGGSGDMQVAPGQTKTITFKATVPGLFVYHCATPMVPQHIASGMYGMILVEPAGGLKPVDHEFYVMQGELYTNHPFGYQGHQDASSQHLMDEQPQYYVFNGAVGALTKEYKMQAHVGDSVRIFFGDGGPNKVSSFHVVGEIFGKAYNPASPATAVTNVQTRLVAPGDATIVEFKAQYPGTYALVDHALARAGKGLQAAIDVSGKADRHIYHAGREDADQVKVAGR